MKEINRKNVLDLPYGLHDARVNRIDLNGEQISLWFDEGYYKPVDNDSLLVKGHIILEGVDVDFCHVYLMDIESDYGTFIGKKFTIQQFIAKYSSIDFEIIDETYGYNMSRFSGFFYEGANTKECIVEIYHFGHMTYLTEE